MAKVSKRVAANKAKKMLMFTPLSAILLTFNCVALVWVALFHNKKLEPGSPLVAVVLAS